MKDTDREKNTDPCKDCICRWICLKLSVEQGFFPRKYVDIHQPNTLANRVRKRIQDFHSRGDPFCQTVVTTLGLAESGDLFSENGEDTLGGVTRLKAGKERMGSQIFLRLAFVRLQRSVENGSKVRIGGGCGGFGRHGGSRKRVRWMMMSE